jgi:hypothetical protein
MESLLFSKENSDVSEADEHHQASFGYGKNVICFYSGTSMEIDS